MIDPRKMSIQPRNVIITGKIGSGKTTFVKQILKLAGTIWGGFFTERISDAGGAIAHRILTSDGRSAVFAHQSWNHLPKFRDMGYDYRIFEELGVDILRKVRNSADLIIMDELGFMEKDAQQFQQEVIKCFDCEIPVLAVIKSHSMDHW